jgi:octanoyl-[GcvH]:protein N-octanoyltransferase
MALTGALLEAVAAGSAPDAVRVFRPGPTVAFGRLDRIRPGFARACERSAEHGWVPVLRWGGGRAAPYGPDCVLVEVIRAQEGIVGGLEERFEDVTALVRETVAGLGIHLGVGEQPGEYCPGRFSLHLPGGGPKVAGVAQRVISGASLTTTALVVGGGEALRSVTAAVYDALELPFDPATAGALTEARPDLRVADVAEALHRSVRDRYGATPAALEPEVTARAHLRLGEVMIDTDNARG